MEYASGPNYRINIEDTIARCEVWRRPDIDADGGARLAEEMRAAFEKLAKGPARAMILDLRHAPTASGPRTQAATARMLDAFEKAGRPIAVLIASGVQSLQLSRLVRTHAPTQGRHFEGDAEAMTWVVDGLGDEKRTPRR